MKTVNNKFGSEKKAIVQRISINLPSPLEGNTTSGKKKAKQQEDVAALDSLEFRWIAVSFYTGDELFSGDTKEEVLAELVKKNYKVHTVLNDWN